MAHIHTRSELRICCCCTAKAKKKGNKKCGKPLFEFEFECVVLCGVVGVNRSKQRCDVVTTMCLDGLSRPLRFIRQQVPFFQGGKKRRRRHPTSQ